MRIDMKMEKMSQKALERKSNKPIMEKKRRARINHCLNQLKALILETDNERSRHSKLEKADILEMTVRYLQTLRAYHLHLTQLHQLQQPPQSTGAGGHPALNPFQLSPLPSLPQVQAQSPAAAAQQLQLQLQQLQQHQHLHPSKPPHHHQQPQSPTSQQQLPHHLLHHHHHHHLHNQPISPAWRPW